MEDQKQTSFTFEIDNFFEKETVILSPQFSSGGCKWFVKVYPKGDCVEDHLSLYLFVANSKSLRLGWKRRASSSFLLLNQSGKEIHERRLELPCQLFCAQVTGWGIINAVPLKKLQEKGLLEKNKLIITVQVKVVEVVDEAQVTGKEMLDVRGFQVLSSQVIPVCWIFIEHPDIAVNFRPKSELVKTTYMNILLGLIETLNKPPHSLSENELSNSQSEFKDLTEAGFKLDWLKEKLDKVSLERKKTNADGTEVQELLGEQIKNLRAELNTVSLERKKTNADGTEVQELEEQIKNLKAELNTEKVKSISLELTVLVLRAELSKEKAKSATRKNVLEGVVNSWEVLDYADLSNEKVE